VHELEHSTFLLHCVHSEPALLARLWQQCGIDTSTDDEEWLAAASLEVANGYREGSLILIQLERL
jgi:regulation of enolase protein 1 (concanavalin A-like superfamily)